MHDSDSGKEDSLFLYFQLYIGWHDLPSKPIDFECSRYPSFLGFVFSMWLFIV